MQAAPEGVVVGPIGPDGRIDRRKSAWMTETPVRKFEPIPIQNNWDILVHGSNLGRAHWADEATRHLDAETLEIKGNGLSVVTQTELVRQAAELAQSSTTKQYSHGSGVSLEIRVAFPAFSNRDNPLSAEEKETLVEKFGQERLDAFLELTDRVHWNNFQSGRHPLLPSGMVLRKLNDQFVPGRGRVLQYVPEVLFELYQSEL